MTPFAFKIVFSKSLTLIWLCLLLWGTAAQGLTLQEALQLGLEHNLNLERQNVLTRAQKRRVESVQGQRMPTLVAGYDYSVSHTERPFTGDALSTGSLTLSYNLYDSGQTRSSIDLQQTSLSALEVQELEIRNLLIFQIKQSYINVLRKQKALEVDKEAVLLLTSQRKDREAFFKQGLIAKNQLLQVEVELSSALQAMLQTESELRTAKNNLERLINHPVPSEEFFEDPEPRGEGEFQLEALVNFMLENRSDLKRLTIQLKRIDQQIANQKSQLKPTVDTRLRYLTFGDTLVPYSSDDLAEKQATSHTYNDDIQFQLSANWPLFDGESSHHEVRALQQEKMAVQLAINDLRQDLANQLKNALELYQLARGRLKLVVKEIEQAEENYRIVENQVKQAIATSTDLLDARVVLSRARNQSNQARYDLLLAIAQVEFLVQEGL